MLQRVRESLQTGQPLQWTRAHDLPGYVYFNHSIHVNKGVGCAAMSISLAKGLLIVLFFMHLRDSSHLNRSWQCGVSVVNESPGCLSPVKRCAGPPVS